MTDAGWAQSSTSQNGWVPSNGLPVAQRAGETDRISFFRLSGTGTVLKLGVLSRESSPLNDTARVKLCPITAEKWRAGAYQQLQNAPTYDAESCVAGRRGERALFFSFDLARYPQRVGGKGFVVIPNGGTGPTFEIVFDRTPYE